MKKRLAIGAVSLALLLLGWGFWRTPDSVHDIPFRVFMAEGEAGKFKAVTLTGTQDLEGTYREPQQDPEGKRVEKVRALAPAMPEQVLGARIMGWTLVEPTKLDQFRSVKPSGTGWTQRLIFWGPLTLFGLGPLLLAEFVGFLLGRRSAKPPTPNPQG